MVHIFLWHTPPSPTSCLKTLSAMMSSVLQCSSLPHLLLKHHKWIRCQHPSKSVHKEPWLNGHGHCRFQVEGERRSCWSGGTGVKLQYHHEKNGGRSARYAATTRLHAQIAMPLLHSQGIGIVMDQQYTKCQRVSIHWGREQHLQGAIAAVYMLCWRLWVVHTNFASLPNPKWKN
jgi:hypothetical protein